MERLALRRLLTAASHFRAPFKSGTSSMLRTSLAGVRSVRGAAAIAAAPHAAGSVSQSLADLSAFATQHGTIITVAAVIGGLSLRLAASAQKLRDANAELGRRLDKQADMAAAQEKLVATEAAAAAASLAAALAAKDAALAAKQAEKDAALAAKLAEKDAALAAKLAEKDAAQAAALAAAMAEKDLQLERAVSVVSTRVLDFLATGDYAPLRALVKGGGAAAAASAGKGGSGGGS